MVIIDIAFSNSSIVIMADLAYGMLSFIFNECFTAGYKLSIN